VPERAAHGRPRELHGALRRWLGLGLITLVLAVGIAVALLGGDDQSASGRQAAVPIVAVERRDLVDRLSVDGTLGFAGSAAVISRLGGTFTWLPAAGAVIRPGRTLFEVDEKPVVLLDGRVPAYRDLELGVGTGPDVRQLERGLSELGFDDGGMGIDARFTEATAAAIRDWQGSLNLKETGRVALGRVVFLPGARRVTSQEVELGSSAGSNTSADPAASSSTTQPAASSTQVMTTSSTRSDVTADLDAADQSLAVPGRRARITLPDGRRISGRVTNVGTVASASQPEAGTSTTGDDPEEATVEVTITPARGAKVPNLDQAPVSVELTKEVRPSVLVVPVSALIATEGGGFAVIVHQGEESRTVPVEPGLFAGGYVEVKGAALREGDQVEVPEE
jgi:multidrug efflux system membrane fusion protein